LYRNAKPRLHFTTLQPALLPVTTPPKATAYYTTSYAATTYYTEAPKFYSVLSYHTIKEAEHYTTNASATYNMEISKC
jgi:hypothetical protein